MYVSLNGKLLRPESALIAAGGEGLFYGYGLFETLKIAEGRIIFIEEHLKRLMKGCSELKLSLDYDFNRIETYAQELVLANAVREGSLKILYAKHQGQCLLWLSTKAQQYEANVYQKGVKLCIASGKRNPEAKLTYIKSNNYLENILEWENALRQGYDEAIFLNTDYFISEGTRTNIFFVQDSKLYTPSLSCGILPGIMRSKVLELIDRLGLDIEIGAFKRADLQCAGEIFLTNSLMEIMPVARLENQDLDMENNPMTRFLQKEFRRLYG